MRVVIFCHSIRSDWNHGNAHFLRGVATELQSRGHDVVCWEPEDGWSAAGLAREAGPRALDAWRAVYPGLTAALYPPAALDLDEALDGADLVLVHEWNAPELVAGIGRRRARGGSFRLLFHDTHHRSVTDPHAMAALDLSAYDGVLAFGALIAEQYRARGWARRVWTWHEAADVRVFRPRPGARRGLIWIGNWGDEERTAELGEFLIDPIRELGIGGDVYGVRYPTSAREMLAGAGLHAAGWTPNFEVPALFAAHRVTVHVPRRPYARQLPGIPTIRVFEALACGIPLICAPWEDVEGLFTPGEDYLVARNGREMVQHLDAVLRDDGLAEELASQGRRTIARRHTCTHRVDELIRIAAAVGVEPAACEAV